MSEYLSTSDNYKNPAAGVSELELKLTIDDNSVWNSDNMLRTEFIPQTTAAINSGTVYYHFSIQHCTKNPLSANEEHCLLLVRLPSHMSRNYSNCIISESYFTEMKFGWISA
jgi:hypothetical protein